MRIIVTGSRYWAVPDPIWNALTDLYAEHEHLIVVHGAGVDQYGNPCGVDKIADDWVTMGREFGWNVERERHPAEWGRFRNRKAAGPIRNKKMVDLGVWCERCQVEGLLAAWPQGESRGTRGCMQLAEDAGIRVVNYSEKVGIE